MTEGYPIIEQWSRRELFATGTIMDMLWLNGKILVGTRLRMEPVEDRHLEGLFQSAGEQTFKHFSSCPEPWTPIGFGGWLQNRTAAPFLCMAMVEIETDRVVGCSTFFDASETHRHLEIGYTWIATDMRGTWVNPESKLLMIDHAFDTLKTIRVQIKCDDMNARSKAAIIKLGATFEGVLRNNMLLHGEYLRSTAYFSILPEEWPKVRAGLVERISQFSKNNT